MAGTIITDVIQAASTSQLNIKNGVALTPPTISDVNNVAIGTFCRAWVNFNGSGTVAIRASFNVSSITDNAAGLYTVNFTNAMPDVNYSVGGWCGGSNVIANRSANISQMVTNSTYTTTALCVFTRDEGGTIDPDQISVQIFR